MFYYNIALFRSDLQIWSENLQNATVFQSWRPENQTFILCSFRIGPFTYTLICDFFSIISGIKFSCFAGIPVFMKCTFIYFQPVLEAFSPDSHTFQPPQVFYFRPAYIPGCLEKALLLSKVIGIRSPPLNHTSTARCWSPTIQSVVRFL